MRNKVFDVYKVLGRRRRKQLRWLRKLGRVQRKRNWGKPTTRTKRRRS